MIYEKELPVVRSGLIARRAYLKMTGKKIQQQLLELKSQQSKLNSELAAIVLELQDIQNTLGRDDENDEE